MKQALQLRLSQHLTLTPQLQQSIKLLQLSTTELNQELERFLMENPMLEREESSAGPVALPLNGSTSSQSESRENGADAAPQESSTADESSSYSEQDWSIGSGGSFAGERSDDSDSDDYQQGAADTPSL